MMSVRICALMVSEVRPMPCAAFTAFVRDEIARWAEIVEMLFHA